MEPYLIITALNDFVFCPRSIYFHNLYGRYNHRTYKQAPQIVGTIKHEAIEKGEYSSKKRYVQGLEIYSEKYRLCGKIDIYDTKTQTLIERKTKIKTIYDGYKYQVWAQYFCLQEMGYSVQKIKFHSLLDNKNYFLNPPNPEEVQVFEDFVQQVRLFDMHDSGFAQNPEKCANCIYSELCDSCASQRK